MTTLADALPNIPPSISRNSCFASSRVGRIRTPFPAASPSAFSTYGAFKVSKKAHSFFDGCTVKGLVSSCRNTMSLHESLGKVLRTFQYCACFRWSDDRDCGCASIFLEGIIRYHLPMDLPVNDHHVDLSLIGKVLETVESFTPMAIFSPTSAVPAFPGAMNSLLHFALCAIFHAKACSLPPLPKSSIFINRRPNPLTWRCTGLLYVGCYIVVNIKMCPCS